MKHGLLARALRRIFSLQTARYFARADNGPWETLWRNSIPKNF